MADTPVNIDDFSGRAVLVTGGAGFVGSHLVEELVGAGADVTIVDDLSTGSLENLSAVSGSFTHHRVDLAADDLRPVLADCDPAMVFHLAANAYVPPSVEDPRLDFAMNATATLNLLEALREVRPSAPVVFTSTAAVYGESRGRPFVEGDPTEPVAPYAVSKLCAERYVAVYPRIFGMRTAIVRLFSTYGPRLRKQVVYDLMGKVHADPNELPILGDGSQRRDFNHVSNVIEALRVVARGAEFTGDVYNVAADEPVSIRELADRICEAMGCSPRYLFSGDVRSGDANVWTANIERIHALGYRPRLRLAEGLVDTVAWFRTEAGVRA